MGVFMNKTRRQQIKTILTQISVLIEKLDNIKTCEDDTRSNIPENLENSEAYQKSEEFSDAISDAISDIQNAVSALEDTL